VPGPDGSISIALDFDGSLVEANVTPLRWRPHAKEFVLGAAAAGIKQWLYSCRCAVACNLVEANPWEPDEFWRTGNVSTEIETSWALYEEMRAFLEAEGIWQLVTPWTLPGKPFADIIADDKAEAPDWGRLAAELGVHLAPAFPGGVSSPHAQQGRPAENVRRGGASTASAPDPLAVAIAGTPAPTEPAASA
jgi:hypothetical protein